VPTARSQRSRPDRKLLKTVTPERVRTTTASDLLANRWQLAVLLPPGMRQAGCWTRPVLLVWGGAPPPESNRRPHPYHSCCRAPVLKGAEVKRSGVSVADRGVPKASCSEWHGDGTAGGDDGGSGLVATVPARAMGRSVQGDTSLVGKPSREGAAGQPSSLARWRRSSRRTGQVRLIGGGAQWPWRTTGWGAYRRMVMPNGPRGAGSQLDCLSAPGSSCWR